jgi:hypothetical protein
MWVESGTDATVNVPSKLVFETPETNTTPFAPKPELCVTVTVTVPEERAMLLMAWLLSL